MDKIVPELRTVNGMKLIGMRKVMSFTHNTTFKLWNSFMPLRKKISCAKGHELYSVQLYPDNFFMNFNPLAEFEKWAAVEVSDFSNPPEGMEALEIPSGRYAVFHYKGNHENAQDFYTYIFREWLPASGYALDNRPHFEVMGEKYKHGSPDSEEEVWIPIR